MLKKCSNHRSHTRDHIHMCRGWIPLTVLSELGYNSDPGPGVSREKYSTEKRGGPPNKKPPNKKHYFGLGIGM